MAGGVGSPPKRATSRESIMGGGRGRDALLEGWEESGGLPENQEGLGRSGEVGWPAWRVSRGREAHLQSRVGSIEKEEYGRPSCRAGKG